MYDLPQLDVNDIPQLDVNDIPSSSYMDTAMNFTLTYSELLLYYTYQEQIEADSENGNATSSFNSYLPVDSNTTLSSQSFTYDSLSNEEEINPAYSDQVEFGDASSSFNSYQPAHSDTSLFAQLPTYDLALDEEIDLTCTNHVDFGDVSSSFNPYQPAHSDTSLFAQLPTYDLALNEEIDRICTNHVDFGDASATPSFNPQQLTNIDVTSFPQSPSCISSPNTTPIYISSSSTSNSSTLQHACSSYSEEENFSDNITDNEYSDGDDEVFSVVENACTRCGTDMGEMNPRQLCGKVCCLIYN